MKVFKFKYSPLINERNMYPKTVRKYTTTDITNWVKYGKRLGLYKLDGSDGSEKKVFAWIDYLLKSGNINI